MFPQTKILYNLSIILTICNNHKAQCSNSFGAISVPLGFLSIPEYDCITREQAYSGNEIGFLFEPPPIKNRYAKHTCICSISMLLQNLTDT